MNQTFDTLTTTRVLEASGMKRETAEAVAEAFRASQGGHATKANLTETEIRIEVRFQAFLWRPSASRMRHRRGHHGSEIAVSLIPPPVPKKRFTRQRQATQPIHPRPGRSRQQPDNLVRRDRLIAQAASGVMY